MVRLSVYSVLSAYYLLVLGLQDGAVDNLAQFTAPDVVVRSEAGATRTGTSRPVDLSWQLCGPSGSAWEAMRQWMETNNHPLQMPVREVHHKGGSDLNDESYVTEFQFPLA